MSLIFNNTEVEEVIYNNTTLAKIICNGVTVYQKLTPLSQCIMLWSDEPFIFGYYNSLGRRWVAPYVDGMLYYSIDRSEWLPYYSASYLTAGYDIENNRYVLYLRGRFNHYIVTQIDEPSNYMYVFYKADLSGQASNIHMVGNIENLLDYQVVMNGQHPEMYSYAFSYAFQYQNLVELPELPATALTTDCYKGMFYKCETLTKAVRLPATTLAYGCYSYMFFGCRNLIMTHTTQGTHNYGWTVPAGSISLNALEGMLANGGTGGSTPAIEGTTYYWDV